MHCDGPEDCWNDDPEGCNHCIHMKPDTKLDESFIKEIKGGRVDLPLIMKQCAGHE